MSSRVVTVVLSIIIIITVMLFATNQASFLGDSIYPNTYASSSEYSVQIDTITTGQGPCGLVVDEYGNKLFVSNYKVDKVSVIDQSTLSVIDEVGIAGTPCGLAIDSKNEVIYVISERSNSIYSLDGSTHDIKSNFSFDLPYEMVVSAKTGLLYVTSDENDKVFALDPAGNLVSKFEIADPCGITINQEKDVVYVSSESTDQVYVIDASANKVVTTIPVEDAPRGLAFNPKTNTLFVANTGSSSVTTIDGVENKVIGTVKVNEPPRRIAVNPNTDIAYLISSKNTLSLLDASSNSVIKSVPVESPYEIVVDENRNRVYVSNSNSDIVYMIKGYERAESQSLISSPLVVAIVAVLAVGMGVVMLFRYRKLGRNRRDKGIQESK